MKFTSNELLDHFSHLILKHCGAAVDFTHTSDPKNANTNSLVFVGKNQSLPEQAAVIITDLDVFDKHAESSPAFMVAVSDVRMAMALMKQRFQDYDSSDSEWPAIHDTAVIHESVKMGLNCRIGPYVVVGANVVLGDDVIVRAGAVVEHDAQIGDGCILHVNVNIGYGCILGENVIVKANAVIGGEGFGFVQDQDHAYHRIPHTGIAIIEDDVRIGSCSCVDRATFGETIVERGTKIDNLVHVAHNCVIGEHAILVSQTGIAGSTVLGKRVVCSGQTGILDHKTVVDDVVLVHRAAVLQDVLKPGVYGGSPTVPYKDHMKRRRANKRLDILERKVAQLTALLEREVEDSNETD